MKIGDIMVNAAYLGSKVLTAIAVGATKVWEGVSKYIKFADPVVEQICMKWSSDGVGLTSEDAAKVTLLSNTFRQNESIQHFNELKYFTSITEVKGEFYNCKNLVTISLPPNLPNVGMNAFLQCSSLESVEMPIGIESIGNGAFSACSSLTEIVIPEGVTSIGNEAFRNNTSLVTLFLPNSLIHIGDSAFWAIGISGHVDIPANVTSIGVGAFRQCVNLTSVSILGEVASIGRTCFYNAPLQYVEMYSTTPPLIGDLIFTGNPTIYVPEKSVDAYKNDTNWSAYGDQIKSLEELEQTT